MSTRALMMIVGEEDIGSVKLGSPQDLWKRLRSDSRGVVLFRHFDAEPEGVMPLYPHLSNFYGPGKYLDKDPFF